MTMAPDQEQTDVVEDVVEAVAESAPSAVERAPDRVRIHAEW